MLTSIDCYDCHSINGTDPYCEDPIAPAYLKLQRRCMVPKQNHIGKFPANFCIKMIGTSSKSEKTIVLTQDCINRASISIAVSSKKTVVVRTCVLEDMNSQCGTFKFQNDTLKGCLLTCDYDGCNRGHRLNECFNIAQMLSLFVVLIVFSTKWH